MDNKDDELPDKDAAKEFYARYEPKEILGRYVVRYYEFIMFGSVLFSRCIDFTLEVLAQLYDVVLKKKRA